MMVIPFSIGEGYYSVCILLPPDSIERIEAYDPAVVKMDDIPGSWKHLELKEVIVTYTTDAEMGQVMLLASQGRMRDALKLVTRGFVFRPDRGDFDGPALDVTPGKKETTQ